MTANQIKALIKSEIGNNLSLINPHGVDLRRCLVEPTLETFEDSREPGKTLQLYVVLKEFPDSDRGYQIVCDVDTSAFGLSIRGKGLHREFLGFYGSFLDTLQGM